MARTFGGGSTDVVLVTQYASMNALDTLTCACTFYETGLGGGNLANMVSKTDASATAGVGLFLLQNQSGGHNFHATRWNTTRGQWFWTKPSQNAWHGVAVSYSYSSTSNVPVVSVDGVATSVSQALHPAGTAATGETTDLKIGNNVAATRNYAGNLAFIALWNVALDATALTWLSLGGDPLQYPVGLVLYVPMWGNNAPEPNLCGGSGAVTGTVQVAGPRFVPRGASRQSPSRTAAAVASGGHVLRPGLYW